MKICVLHSFYRSGPSGENKIVESEIAALRGAGHEVLLLGKYSDELINDATYEMRTGLGVITGLGATPGRALQEFRPDVLQIHNLFPNWSDGWLKANRFPVVSTIHNFRPMCAAGTLARNGKFCDLCPTEGSWNAVRYSCYQDSRLRTIPLALKTKKPNKNGTLRFSDRLIFKSMHSLEIYKSHVDQRIGERAVVIPNFVDAPPQSRTGSEPAGRNFWIYAGRLAEDKGILELVRNWPSDLPLRIFGSGTLERQLRAEARHKSIEFKGTRSSSEVIREMGHAIGLVFPSTWKELSPLVFLEALSVGLPVVAKEGNAAANEILESECGKVFDEFSEIVQAIHGVESQWKRLSANARRAHEQKFSKASWLTQIIDTYRSVVG